MASAVTKTLSGLFSCSFKGQAGCALEVDEMFEIISTTKSPDNISLETLIEKSEEFNRTIALFKVRMTLCQILIRKDETKREKLQRYVNEAYPIVHERVLLLLANFLKHKKVHGNKVEKSVYHKMDLLNFIDRLLTKRPVVFVGPRDIYILRDGKEGLGAFNTIGTTSEKSPHLLKDYLSYDEMKVSAFISTSSDSFFINKGDRYNRGKVEEEEAFEGEGLIISLIGPRFEMREKMEWQDMVVSESQNNDANGYGPGRAEGKLPRLWADFYEESHFPLFEEVRKGGQEEFVELMGGYFNTKVYKKRIQLSAETLLIEVNHRAKMAGKKAYVHMVGIGLGVWAFLKSGHKQEFMFMDAFGQCFEDLADKLEWVSDVHFSWFSVKECRGVTDGQAFPGTGVTLHFSKRNPQDKLIGEHEGKLSVSCWAWDSNSLPGNEYWAGHLTGSGDSAAAANSQITELHNPYINPAISASNLHVASKQHGVLKVQEYCKMLLKKDSDGVAGK